MYSFALSFGMLVPCLPMTATSSISCSLVRSRKRSGMPSDDRRIRLEEDAGLADVRGLALGRLARQISARAHLLDVLLVVGWRRHRLRRPRDRRQQLDRRERLAGDLLSHLLDAGAPGRQRGDHGVALHVVAGALPDLVLGSGHVVDHVADHNAKPVLVKTTKLHPVLLGATAPD
jgi:hypothetical protein